MYLALLRYNVLCISVWSLWSQMEFKFVSLLTLNSGSGSGEVANLQNSLLSFFFVFSCFLIFLDSYTHVIYIQLWK